MNEHCTKMRNRKSAQIKFISRFFSLGASCTGPEKATGADCAVRSRGLLWRQWACHPHRAADTNSHEPATTWQSFFDWLLNVSAWFRFYRLVQTSCLLTDYTFTLQICDILLLLSSTRRRCSGRPNVVLWSKYQQIRKNCSNATKAGSGQV